MDLSELGDRFSVDTDNISRRDFTYPGLLTLVFIFALWIRMIPAKGMKYLQALDPYMISRMSRAVAKGSLPMLDVWRYFPFIKRTYALNFGDIYIPAYIYNLVSWTGTNFIEYAQVYPAVVGAFMVVALYFVGKEISGRRTGILSAFFLAASPAVLHRSSAGWFEKEPLSALLMFTSVYFVLRAWKRKEWTSGILAGVSLGISMTVWGGAKFLFLFYPLVMFPVALINEDIENLLIAFTPAIILGHFLPAILNPAIWSVPNGPLVMSLGILLLVWIRYYAEAMELVEDRYLTYVVPGLSVLGGFMLLLSPLYSQTLASYVQAVKHKALQSTGAVVAGTVAENQPASAAQIVGQLGTYRAASILPRYTVLFSEFFSGWTLSLVGTAVLSSLVGFMLLRKYTRIQEVGRRKGYAAFTAVFILITIFFSVSIPGSALQAFLYGVVVAVAGAGFLFVARPEGKFGGFDDRWYLLIPLLWMVSTLYGATQRSRLIFLASHPVALLAGYGLSTGIGQFRESDVWGYISETVESLSRDQVYFLAVTVFLVPVVVFNAAAAYSMAQNVGGSPNPLWMENLEFMREETPPDSVVLSWWDYGYWFETIGARAAIADGGNAQFYSNAIGYHIINMPLADFLTAENTTRYMDWLKSYSVDYVVLDSSMIGKYSAVSQIHHRSNQEFNAMQTFSCIRRKNSCATTSSNNTTYIAYQSRGSRLFVPVQRTLTGVEFKGAALMQTGRGTTPVENLCTGSGIEEVDIPENRSTIPGCVAFHPYREYTQAIYIPPEVMGSTLVNLYVMDAAGMKHFDEVFDNGYVKMWKVDYTG